VGFSYAPFFASVFSKAFEQFQRYISGVIVSENKTIAMVYLGGCVTHPEAPADPGALELAVRMAQAGYAVLPRTRL
jgi:hypothetical protein